MNKDTTLRNYNSLDELLKLNIGKMITLPLDGKQTICSINNVVDNTLVIESGKSLCFIPFQNLGNIEFIDKPITRLKSPPSLPTYSLDIKLLNDAKNQQINMSYLQKGITWLPTYFIDIREPKKGKLTLEANLLNDIEDIENSEINFAVGVPTFAFKSVNEPLVSNKSIWEILRQLNGQQRQEFSEGIQMNIMSQRSNYNNIEQAEDFKPAAEGVGGEDLYFYEKQNISLNKNGRLKTQLLTMDFDYEDVYSCELNINTESFQEKKSTINPVWHSIRFKNNSNKPLTTGTVFFRKENKSKLTMISQNQLDYTPVNEFITAKMAVAPDIIVSEKDVETERNPYGYDFILNINAEINIINYKAFPIEMIVNRIIIGTTINSDLPWKVTSSPYDARNMSNQVSWRLKVEPGKSVLIKYKYTMIVD